MKKNIVFPIEFSYCYGGMVQSVISLINYLSKYYDVYILAYSQSEIFSHCSSAKRLCLKHEWVVDLKSPFKTFRTWSEVKHLMKAFEEAETLIFTNNVGTELVFSGFGVMPLPFRRVFVSRGGNYLGKTGRVVRTGFKSACHFVATSNHQRDILNGLGIKREMIEVINNGIEVELNNYSYAFNRTGKIRLSVVGFISENKNQILAVRALALLLRKYKNIELSIYGKALIDSDKKYLAKLQNEIERLKIADKVVFKGFIWDSNEIYFNTDILISCSLSEGFGRTVAEAMAYGIPCIGLTISGGLRDIISDFNNGFLIENDEMALYKKVIALIENEQLRMQISTNAKKTFNSKFTVQNMAAQYMQLIDKIGM